MNDSGKQTRVCVADVIYYLVPIKMCPRGLWMLRFLKKNVTLFPCHDVKHQRNKQTETQLLSHL